MGDIKKVLFKCSVPAPLQSDRITVELCENVHLHYRNLRLEFPKKEFLLILRKLKQLDERDIKNFEYGKGLKFLISDHDLPIKTEFNNRLQVEEQENGLFHIHYKNMRIEFRDDWDGISKNIIKAIK